MAEVGTIVYDELLIRATNVRSGHCSLTGATSTLTSATHKFGSSLITVMLQVRGTNTMTYTVSGATVTITGTNGDVVDFFITGR